MNDLYNELSDFPMNDYVRKADRIKRRRKAIRRERIAWFIIGTIAITGFFATLALTNNVADLLCQLY